MEVVGAENRAPSSNGGDGSPASSSSAEGLRESEIPVSRKLLINSTIGIAHKITIIQTITRQQKGIYTIPVMAEVALIHSSTITFQPLHKINQIDIKISKNLQLLASYWPSAFSDSLKAK